MSTTATLMTLALAAALPQTADEADYTTVDHLAIPDGERMEVGGLAFLPDGRLVVSTRRGQVWLVENALADDPAAARFSLFAEGLQEGLGLAVVDGEVLVLQRGELSRLLDVDGDGSCDRIDTISNDWGLSGHYHEFAFGLPRDPLGNFYVSLNVSFGDPQWWHGRSTAPWRGWVMKIAPDGATTPFASGYRSPCGLGTNAAGDLFLTDNQGDWMPACPIVHVREGTFFSHPASLNWTPAYLEAGRTASDTVPPQVERARAAVWIPYDWSRSAGNLVTAPRAFGPFEGQFLVAELTNGYVLRAQLEKVRGEYQGAVFPFRRGVGSAVRATFSPDGKTLLVGLTERGWGGQSPGDGIARIRSTGRTPMEMHSLRLANDGFRVRFTLPLEGPLEPAQVRLEQYDYDWWWEYGSPTRNNVLREVRAVELSDDRREAVIRVANLTPGMVARLKLEGVVGAGGEPLLHTEAAYTINQLPEGPLTDRMVARLVPAPEARERSDEGVLWLTQGDPLDAWTGAGWVAGDVRGDPDDARRFLPREEGGEGNVLSNLGPLAEGQRAGDLLSKIELGDVDLTVEFKLPKDGNSGIYLMGRYEVQLLDSSGVEALGYGDCGGIYRGASWPGKAPDFNAFRGPDRWHSISIAFRAPRFDESGRKVRDARFLRVMMNDVLLQENVDVPEPTGGAFEGEVPFGPLRIQGDHGPVAVRNIRVLDRTEREDQPGWEPIFDGTTLDGWRISDGGAWKVEEGLIVGSGPRSHLFSPRDDYRDFELRARVRINEGGNSGMYFRTTFGPGWPAGYEAQVNSTHSDPVKTGSLYGLALVKTQFISPDTWFTQHVRVRDVAEGVHVTIRVNDVVVTDFVDTERKHAAGHAAFQQHHEGSIVHYKDVEVRELR